MNNYIINEAQVKDLPRIINIWKQGFSHQASIKPSDFSDDSHLSNVFLSHIRKQDSNFKFWVYKNDKKEIIGWQSILPFSESPNPVVSNGFGLSSTYVSTEHHGRGIGISLLKHALNYSTYHTTLKYIFGMVLTENYVSLKLCEKVGFTNMGTLPKVKDLEDAKWDLVVYEV